MKLFRLRNIVSKRLLTLFFSSGFRAGIIRLGRLDSWVHLFPNCLFHTIRCVEDGVLSLL